MKGRYLVQDIILTRTTFCVRAPRKLILVAIQGLLGPAVYQHWVHAVIGLLGLWIEGKSKRPSDNWFIMSVWGVEQEPRGCFADVTNCDKITSATQTTSIMADQEDW